MTRREVVYLDNAATSLWRPPEVVDAVCRALTSMGNAGRGATAESLDAARVVESCREEAARLFGCGRADHVCFTANSTEALNIAIQGLVGEGDRVVTTVLEHNSVLRPLARMADEKGVEVACAGCDARGVLDYGDLERLVTPGTRLVVCTHGSNVTGNVCDLARVSRIAHAAGALLVVDASQTAGNHAIDMASMGIDVLCFTGHKGLMGPQGTGGLCVADGVDVRPLIEGGTGVHSFDRRQPGGWPTRLEAGTLNVHGLAGLLAALRYIESVGGPEVIGEHERELATDFVEGVRGMGGIDLYGDLDQPGRCGIVALNVRGMGSADISDILMSEFGVATRPGAHCAPLMHRALGTSEQGIVRFSFGWHNTSADVSAALRALAAITG